MSQRLQGPAQHREGNRMSTDGSDVVDVQPIARGRRLIAASIVIGLGVLVSSYWWSNWVAVRVDQMIVMRYAAELSSLDKDLWQQAESGNVDAVLRVVDKAVETGKPSMLAAAETLLRLSYREGSHAAASDLAWYLKEGKFGTARKSEAVDWDLRAIRLMESKASSGDDQVMWDLGEALTSGTGIAVDVGRGRDLKIAAAKKNPGRHGRLLGNQYSYGDKGFVQNEDQALGWYLEAANATQTPRDLGDIASRIRSLASGAKKRGESEEFVSRMRRASADLYIKAARQGNPESMHEVASAKYYTDPYFDEVDGDSVNWTIKAMNAGSYEAHFLRAAQLLTPRSNVFPGPVDELLLKGWRMCSAGKEDNDQKNRECLSDAAWAIRIDSTGNSIRTSPMEVVRSDAWLNAYKTVNSQPERYFSRGKDLVRAKALASAILAMTRMDSIPAHWPEVDWSGVDWSGFVPLDAAAATPPATKKAAVSSSASGRGAANSAASRDPDQLERTGYVPGAPLVRGEGLSKFTVDNRSGGRDAVARIYLGGQKPAVRTFFVKSSEQFTAENLASGSYVLRYRYMGSDDTYEADRIFKLEEVNEEGGRRYSTVRVTLYSVKEGNLSTKRVAAEQF